MTPALDPAAEVTHARKAALLSVRALARASGISASTITRVEHGALEPTVSTLVRLLAACGRGLQVVDGAPRLSRAQQEQLSSVELLAAHADEILELLAEEGLQDVRIVDPADLDEPGDPDDPDEPGDLADLAGLDEEGDDIAFLLYARPEELPTGYLVPLQNELQRIIGRRALLLWAGRTEPIIERARRGSQPLGG